MPKYQPLTKNDLRERIKEIEDRIKQMEQREKLLGDFKAWMATKKLEPADISWMLKSMKPKRAKYAVVSKNPLQPSKLHPDVAAVRGEGKLMHKGKTIQRKGDPEFRRAIQEARVKADLTSEELAKRVGVSSASIGNWEQGRNVPKDDQRKKLLQVLQLPTSLGAQASLALNGSGAA